MIHFNTSIPKTLKPFYNDELVQYSHEFKKKHYQVSWRHLERAHILAQPYPLEHTIVHWKMFCFGIRLKNSKEILGQVRRLLFGGIKSFVGHVPVGNTGGANVPRLMLMEIPRDLAEIIENAMTKHH